MVTDTREAAKEVTSHVMESDQTGNKQFNRHYNFIYMPIKGYYLASAKAKVRYTRTAVYIW